MRLNSCTAWLPAAIVATLTSVSAAFASAQVPTCGGADMLAEMRTANPAMYAKISADATKTTNDGALLWKISKAGHKPSYLFGTIHLSDTRVTTLSPAATAALASTTTTAVEIADLDDKAIMQAAAVNPQLLFYMDGRRLDDMLSETEFSTVSRTLTSMGMPKQMQPMVRPWLIAMILAISDCERSRLANKLLILDNVIEQRAKSSGKKIVGLESIASQIHALTSISNDDQIAMLKSVLRYAHRADDVRETLLQLYLKRQMGVMFALQRHFATEAGLPPEAMRGFEMSVISARNHTMLATSLPLIQSDSTFIAVGAGHLVGSDGLVALLRNAGYELTPVE